MGGVLVSTSKIGEILIERGLINELQLKHALDYQEKFGGRIGWILLSLGYISKKEFYSALSEQYGIEYISPSIKDLDSEIIREFSPKELWDNQCLPIKLDDNTLIVATSYPRDNLNLHFIVKRLKKRYKFHRVKLTLISDNDLQRIIQIIFHQELVHNAVYSLKEEDDDSFLTSVLSSIHSV